jgi:Tol biopolymer transport system component
MIGKTISHYKILEKLGEGGMGTVYKAEDTKLDRFVALKFLPPHLSQDEENKKRFIHEAKAASALEHNNICNIHEIDETEDGQMFIAMAYYEGETLKSMIDDRRLTIQEALDIAIQVAEGLTKAHSREIVHRDIKPANIIITDDKIVKILDFGLAKLSGRTQLTREGTTLGTVAYMSPEQAQGVAADHRTDVWSLGAILYEMVTGLQPFAGDYEQAVMYSIMNEDPEPLTGLRTGVPMELERIVNKAMAKSPDERYQHVDEMLTDLKALKRQLTSMGSKVRPAEALPPKNKRRAYAGITAALLLLIFLAIYFWREVETTSRRAGDARLPRLMQVTLRQVTFSADLEEYPAFSPDGQHIAYCRDTDGYKHIHTKNLETGEVTQHTEGAFDDIHPAWSPDGQTILFVRSNQPDGKVALGDIFGMHADGDIWRMNLESGKERKLIEEAFNPSFSPDGQRMAFDASWAGPRRIWIADNLGRNPQQVSFDPSEEVAHVIPRWSPDGSKIVFQNMEKTKFDIKVVDITSKALTSVTDDLFQDINPIWSQSGGAIYFSSYRSGGRNIWRVPISETGRPVGPSQQVTTGAGEDVQLAVSADGKRLAFSILKLNADIWRLQISPKTGQATGDPQGLVSTTREDSRGAWSPDGSMIAFNSDRAGEMNIWVHSLAEDSERQMTRGPGGDYQPQWSPDGKRIVFFSSRAGNADIWAVELASGEMRQLTKQPSLEMNPFFSPDGRWIAYQSDFGGRREVWVMNADGSEQRRLTNIGVGLSHYFIWSCDSRHVFFRNLTDRQVAMKVAVSGGEEESFARVAAGGHMSFSPDCSMIMDNDHKALWLTLPGSKAHIKVFEFDDPEVRIDYSVWSPDGKWVLFDHLKPQGGDIWLMENFE